MTIPKVLFNRVYKKVTAISSAVFIVIAAGIAVAFLAYAEQKTRSELKRKVTEFAVIGGEQSQAMFVNAIDQGYVTLEELFDDDYQKIGLAEFRARYVAEADSNRISDDYVRLLMDRVVEEDVDEYYRYHTAYDENVFLNKRALEIEEPFLRTENIDYAVFIDRNGYIPFHHSVNSQMLTGDLETDTFGNRAKRKWKKTLGDPQVAGEISYYYYRRDTGTPYLNVNVPIMLEGRHWGAFLVGYNATEIDVTVAALRRNAVLAILGVVALTVAIYSIVIIVSLKPLGVLLSGVQRIEQGHLDVLVPTRSNDEIGYLSRAFNSMVASITAAHDQLEEYNRTLTEKVRERTQDLHDKNIKLEKTLEQIKEMQQQLIIQEKMASLGNLVAGVAHEVNTPIGAVHSAADVTRRCLHRIKSILTSDEDTKALAADEQLQQSLDTLEASNTVTTTASERITTIVRSLKTFARLDEADLQDADIHEGLDSTLTLIDHQIKNRVAVDREYGELPNIRCYPNQLNQVFMNILTNASQAIEGTGRITVRTKMDGGNAVIEIADDGEGIPPENLAKVFDPGFTTKGVGVGTGLGLSISHNIIRKHNGEISVDSQVGKGTTFTIILPVEGK